MYTTPTRRPAALTLALALTLLAAGVPASGAAQPTAPGAGATAITSGDPFSAPRLGPGLDPHGEPAAATSGDPFAEPRLGPELDPHGEPTAATSEDPFSAPQLGPDADPHG